MSETYSPTEPLIDQYDVAKIAGVSATAVRNWRYAGKGPRYLRIGGAVRYKPSDVAAWIESRPSGGELPSGGDVRP